MSLPRDLAALADAHGVATSYLDYLDRPVDVGEEAVRLALESMGVAAGGDGAVRRSLDDERERRRAELLPATIVVVDGQRSKVPHRVGGDATASVHLEDGQDLDVAVRGGAVELPDTLPQGYHELLVVGGGAHARAHLIVVPAACPQPPRRGWGWMVQLYQARSGQSWGMGDYADLGDVAEWSATRDASFVLVNPLHAAAPTSPQEPSPYYPSSRRFRSPLYLRLETIPEYRLLGADDQHRVAALGAGAREASAELIDRDAIAAAKTEALRLLRPVDSGDGRRQQFAEYCTQQGQGLVDFATFCAIAQRHGTPWSCWPAELHDPRGGAVAVARAELAADVDFHMWLQWLCDEQLADVQSRATGGGMGIGVIHDLAVGVDPGGADAWALQRELASDVTIGAPPDGFNQRGQDWRLPPLLPRRLLATGFAPFRDMLRSVLRWAGGIRIDHVMGLWRLWWVPAGRSAADGTYVRYPADAMLGVLALEAARAGAVVVGEDLGTVEKGTRAQMAQRGVLSSRVVWFERVDDDPSGPRLPPEDYAQQALTSITTHDLPTAAGWWADADVAVQTELGLYGASTTPQAEARRKAAERHELGQLFVDHGLLDRAPFDPVTDVDDAADIVLAMHRFLARTPSVLIATGLGDALGDRRQPNMPGTSDEYPNWRLPLARTAADGKAQPLLLEDILVDPTVVTVTSILSSRPRARGRGSPDGRR